ncbi:hypothetical protein HMN09_01105500 [Mycena chlorophos]|uniref:Uncharacterized protein n=1 Tax=Mycena chlorophos TaxID=658473 RepID=A0A8H6VWA4_MYCCL|nr:hypothetical protein HMN09_01105500 [Mycena chlorophos]
MSTRVRFKRILVTACTGLSHLPHRVQPPSQLPICATTRIDLGVYEPPSQLESTVMSHAPLPSTTVTPGAPMTPCSITDDSTATTEPQAIAAEAETTMGTEELDEETQTGTRAVAYKGKALRSWAQLPPELIRLIAVYYATAMQETSAGILPLTWTPYYTSATHMPGMAERRTYLTVRDMRHYEMLMRVCPKWAIAIEDHSFYRTAIKLFDPYNHYSNYAWAVPPNPLGGSAASAGVPNTAYRHFQSVYNISCLPCRINAPHSPMGVGGARKVIETPRLGHVAVCKDHHTARRSRWCEVCFKDMELVRHLRRESMNRTREEYARAQQRFESLRHYSAAGHHVSQDAYADAHNHAKQALRAAQNAEVLLDESMDPMLGGRMLDHFEEEGSENSFYGGVFGCAWSVCKACRAEWVWRCAAIHSGVARDPELVRDGRPIPRDSQPLDLSVPRDPAHVLGLGQNVGMFSPLDTTVRDTLRMFLELGEGGIMGVLAQADERGWLRSQTKWSEMMGMVVATRGWESGEAVQQVDDRRRERARTPSPELVVQQPQTQQPRTQQPQQTQHAQWAGKTIALQQGHYPQQQRERSLSPTDGYSEDYSSSDELELEMEMAVEEEMNVRELALGDWARGRILDGSWLSPVDIYWWTRVKRQEHPDARIRAIHPVPWSITPPETTDDVSPARHPDISGPPAPTQTLAEVAHNAYIRQLRTVLLPPMRNIVRRLVLECAFDVVDPTIRAARMTIDDVVREMREEEGVWFDGVDWSERRRNARVEEEREERRERQRQRQAEDAEVSSSDGSGTATTPGKTESPTLSTSTLGTTPSPSADDDDFKVEEDEDETRSHVHHDFKLAIAVDPVRNPPQLLLAIPHVPETLSHMPAYSLDALKGVWREACAPLYHCRCTICVRAAQEQTKAADALLAQAVPPAAPLPQQQQQQQQRARTPAAHGDGPWVVQIPEDDGQHQTVESVVSVVHEGDENNARYALRTPPREGEVIQADEEPLDRDAPLWEGMGAIGYGDDDEQDEEEEEEEDRSSIDSFDADVAPAPKPTPRIVLVPPGGRKRSSDDLAPPTAEQQEAKRPRTKEPPVIRIAPSERGASPVKRRSEELDLDGDDDAYGRVGSDTDSAGSGKTKRARIGEV